MKWFCNEWRGESDKQPAGLGQRNADEQSLLGCALLNPTYELPARPYLRGFLVLYAKAIGYESDRIVNDYMKRYDTAMNPPKK